MIVLGTHQSGYFDNLKFQIGLPSLKISKLLSQKNSMSKLDKKQAVLLNFTANTYHWGCYGTSMELWSSLVERGYYVEMINVREIHLLNPTPQNIEDFDRPDFGIDLLKSNPRIYHLLLSSDLVFVNGEGTLHGASKGAINLLYLMYISKVNFKKPVHLVNGSFFPSDDGQPHAQLDELYGRVARKLDQIVPRETYSSAILGRLGLVSTQGFDCLPRFIARHDRVNTHVFAPTIVVAGGVNLTKEQTLGFGKALAKVEASGARLIFLTGAKAMVNSEDALIFEALKSMCPAITLTNAYSMAQWLDVLSHCACVVSARFHHTLAAVSLGTPCLVFPSNTPKTNASMTMLGMPYVMDIQHDLDKVITLLNQAIQKKLAPLDLSRISPIIKLAAENFVGLEEVTSLSH
jgi:polysaccharide pyruvyl transferase WcaK-like protein